MNDREKAVLWLGCFLKNKEEMVLIPKPLVRLMYEALTQKPTADVRPVVRGELVKTMVEIETPTIKSYTPVWSCPTCGMPFSPDTCKKWAGCPYCLTDMRKDGQE